MSQKRPHDLSRSLRRVLLALMVGGIVAILPGSLQAATYMVVPLGAVPDAYSTIGTGLNDHGHVVGWSQFFGTNAGIKAWLWTPESGFTLLAPPPGMTSSYRAIDINNRGAIAGDGGYDGGESWRLADGVYEVLGTLDDDPISWTAGINESDDVAGTSRANQFLIPYKAFLDTEDAGMAQVLSSATAGYLNDAGQVVGWSQSNTAFVFTPGAGVTFLGDLDGRQLTYAYGINGAGTIVGEASYATGNGHVPFVFTPSGGMQEIGNMGDGAGARSVNDRGEVVGDYELSDGPHSWIWSAAAGLRFFENQIHSTNLRVMSAARINASGIVLVQVLDLTTAERFPALLVPPSAQTEAWFHDDQVTLGWHEIPGAGWYNVYRGSLASLVDNDQDGIPDAGYGDCMNALDPDTTDGSLADTEVPAAGTVSFYVVAGVDPSGREFSLGTTSAGAKRVASGVCP